MSRIKNYYLAVIWVLSFTSLNAICAVGASAQSSNGDGSQALRRTDYVPPVKLVWQSATEGATIEGVQNLMRQGTGQADLGNGNECRMSNTSNGRASILLDFGREMQGGLRIVTGQSATRNPQVRIRYGESVSEAMSEVGDDKGATNDHAMRDFVVTLPWLGRFDTSSSGFRFVRIDLLGESSSLVLKEVNMAYSYIDIKYKGSFECSDARLNDIWNIGAYTVHLNMQEYLWDGIKRDRLVWAGDIYPELMTVLTVFGSSDILERSLDLNRDAFPFPQWMNGLNSYSIWWLLSHYRYYVYTGDKKYLFEQRDYMTKLLDKLAKSVDATGNVHLDGAPFLDWPSSENHVAIAAGTHALTTLAMKRGAEMCALFGDQLLVKQCTSAYERLLKVAPDCNDSKQAASLLSLAGLMDCNDANIHYVAKNGAHGFSTFMGYFMLEAMAKAGDYAGAMDIIRTYWGGMIDLGATTFWEDFDIEWLDNAGRIDDMPNSDKVDVHSTYGRYCYKGLRHSLCHGWASGPTAWLTAHVLGIQIDSPGCRKIVIEPHLGNLMWAKGTFPTPYGVLTVEHKKDKSGKVSTHYKAPRGVKVIVKK